MWSAIIRISIPGQVSYNKNVNWKFGNGPGLCKYKSRFRCSSDQKNCSHQAELLGITRSYSPLRSIHSSLGYGKREFNSETEVSS